MADEKLQKQALNHVLDEESNEIIEVSDDMRRMAQTIQQRIDGATMVTAILLQVVRDQKLYLAWGCGSFKEYSDTMLPFNRQTAYKYITIAEKFAPILPEFKVDGSVSSMRQLEENLSESDKINELSGIGMTKLYELASVPESDFSDVMSDKRFEVNGTEYTFEEIKAQTVQDLQKEVREEKRNLQKRIGDLEEKRKKAEGERDHYKEQLDKNEDLIDRSREREAMHGPEARKIEDIEYHLDRAEAHLTKLQLYLSKVEVDEEHPQNLRDRVLTIIRSATYIDELACRRMPWLEDHKLRELNTFSPTRVKDPMAELDDDFDPDFKPGEDK